MSCKTLVILAIFMLAIFKESAGEFRLDLEINEDEESIIRAYEKARRLMSPDQESFLEKILAADDVVFERQSRGIVDQILAAIANSSYGLNPILGLGTNPIIGLAPSPGGAQSQTPGAAAPSPTVFPLLVGTANRNGTVANTTNPLPQNPNNDNHLFTQITQVLINSATGNVTGIVDNSLKIATPAPVRDFVNAIVQAAYCNGIRRLLGRCR